MSWRILILEDNKVMAESLTDTLRRELDEPEISIVAEFDKAPNEIITVKPDVVVFDIFNDQVEEHPEYGVKPAWQAVWNKYFCPVVFHTGHEVEEYKSINHPFVRYEIKGPGSHGRVANHIKEFKPEIDGLRTIRDELSRSAHETLVDVSPLVWKMGGLRTDLPDMLLRAVRRRMAATLDHPAEPLKKLQAWEQYICPPIGKDLLTGDVLLIANGDKNLPASYRLVLSPSCDLVIGHGSKTLQHVLVADCVPVNEFVAKTQIAPEKRIEKLPSELNKDQVAGLMVLPNFSDVIPLMAANLKKLLLIPYADIATKDGGTKAFTRIASLDSPFRERLAWAYLQVAGRPGVPDIDVQALAIAIDQTIKVSTKA